MHRFAWERLLHRLRQRPRYTVERGRVNVAQFKHRDLVVYAFLLYFWHKFRGDDNDAIFVRKGQLQQATNLPSAADSVGRLHSGFTFKGRNHLFEFREGHHRIQIRKWACFVDPNEDDVTAAIRTEMVQELQAAVADARYRQLQMQAQASVTCPPKTGPDEM